LEETKTKSYEKFNETHFFLAIIVMGIYSKLQQLWRWQCKWQQPTKK